MDNCSTDRSGDIALRQHQPFFNEAVLHADTDKCLHILEQWDFGFVPRVLAFSRINNESISSATRKLQDGALDRGAL
jgi:hypothetical protein